MKQAILECWELEGQHVCRYDATVVDILLLLQFVNSMRLSLTHQKVAIVGSVAVHPNDISDGIDDEGAIVFGVVHINYDPF